jgi:hypothetical protein
VEALAFSPIERQLSANVRVRPQAQGALMQVFVVLVPLAILAACSPGADVTSSTSQCVASNYRSYDEKNFDQCVAACIKCEHGVTTTCTTACTLRGAK